VPSEDLHVTVVFLGQTPVEELPSIGAALAAVAVRTRAFEVGLSGAGSFGGHRRPRVAWLGLGQGRSAVGDLCVEVGDALALERVDDARPHLTVTRRAPPELPAALADRFRDGLPVWLCTELVLYRSHLGPPRSRYEAIGRWPLGRDLPRSGGRG
jgi:2'-5' RNA ligase